MTDMTIIDQNLESFNCAKVWGQARLKMLSNQFLSLYYVQIKD